jgi:hypothetical protein
LWAEIEVYKITMYVPDDLTKWAENDVVDCDGSVTISGNETLFFLLEKILFSLIKPMKIRATIMQIRNKLVNDG